MAFKILRSSFGDAESRWTIAALFILWSSFFTMEKHVFVYTLVDYDITELFH